MQTDSLALTASNTADISNIKTMSTPVQGIQVKLLRIFLEACPAFVNNNIFRFSLSSWLIKVIFKVFLKFVFLMLGDIKQLVYPLHLYLLFSLFRGYIILPELVSLHVFQFQVNPGISQSYGPHLFNDKQFPFI